MSNGKKLLRSAAVLLAAIIFGVATLTYCARMPDKPTDNGINSPYAKENNSETSGRNTDTSYVGSGSGIDNTDMLYIIKDNFSLYTIVRPDVAPDDTVTAAVMLRKKIQELIGVQLNITSDWVKPGTDPDSVSEYEILIGKTNRSASQNMLKSLDGYGWCVAAEGKRIIILAASNSDLEAAIEYFFSICMTGDGEMILDRTKEKTVKLDGMPVIGTALRVGSYNIKHGAEVNFDMSVIAADITALNLDIVGLQEIDQFTQRSNGIDTMKLLSEATGYKYYAFARAMDYKGGEYGTGILSRYPIVSFEVYQLDSGTHEPRSVGHAIIEIDGARIDFFNTHLSFEDKSLREKQFSQLSKLIEGHKTLILTGDFNTSDTKEFSVISDTLLVNNNKYATFPSSQSSIDNIVVSSNWDIKDSGMVHTGHSDHNLLWAELVFKG